MHSFAYSGAAGNPECEEQREPINRWIGGESRALELFDGRLKLEENVNHI